MFLIVIDNSGRHIEKIAPVEFVSSSHTQVADTDPAEQTQSGRIDTDGSTDEEFMELIVYLTADSNGIGPDLVQQGGEDRQPQNRENETSDEPLLPGHVRVPSSSSVSDASAKRLCPRRFGEAPLTALKRADTTVWPRRRQRGVFAGRTT